MIIDSPDVSLIPMLSQLWKEAFGDDDEFISDFFTLGFSPKRALFAHDNEKLAGALYWLDMEYENKKIAYIYGVAVAKIFRGNGIGTLLMNKAQEHLRSHGYDLITLVPSTSDVFRFYEKLGYKTFAYVDEKRFAASNEKISVKKATAAEYFEERKKYCKNGYLTPSEESFDFLSVIVDFYIGKDFIVSLRKGERNFFSVEFLGNFNKIPDLINSLGYTEGTVRADGSDRAFAMYLPLQSYESSMISYLGFAFD